jgi:hypothetical protein
VNGQGDLYGLNNNTVLKPLFLNRHGAIAGTIESTAGRSATGDKTLPRSVAFPLRFTANKMARIAWAIMAKGGYYRAPELAAAA